MLVGYAPFCSKEAQEVYSKILNFKEYLEVPNDVKLSKEALDLIHND